MEALAPTTAETIVSAVGVSASAEATMAEAGAPETAEAVIAEVGAPKVTMAVVMAVRPSMQEAEVQAAEASAVPLAQGPPLLWESAWEMEVYPISSDNTSRAREVVDAEETDAMEQPALLLDEGSSALVRVRPEPHGWDHPRVLWRSQDDPEGEPLFALEDTAEGGRWSTFEQYCELAERSLWTTLYVVADELPGVAQELETRSLGKSVFLQRERGIWDQLQRQRGLLADANELLSARSTEVEDLRLRCADAKVEAATAQTQLAPLAAWIKEQEEELTRAISDRDAFRSRAEEAMASGKVLAGQLGAEESAHQLTKGALNEALATVEASQIEAVVLRGTVEAASGSCSCEPSSPPLATELRHVFLVVAPPIRIVADAATMDTMIAVHMDGNLPSFRCATQPRQPSHGELRLL
ncbi:uncharacterized protein [Miscanthus floridulus]|uniref:uncharacterized protein n=1 Tax=Miscanthus floridulus TaxID=154761 RepID=UPI0034574DCF